MQYLIDFTAAMNKGVRVLETTVDDYWVIESEMDR